MMTMNDRRDEVYDDDANKERKLQPKRFPFRLNKMLNDAETHGNDDIVSWMPCGKMFKVHKHKEFASRIMPLYCRHTRYKSFLRQLSMYKFQRVNEGPLRGCYHHPNFSRDRFDLIDKINRKDRGDEDGSLASSPLASRLTKKSAKLAVRKSIEELLSGSDSDTSISEDNDLESIDRAAYTDSIPTSLDSEKGEKGSDARLCKGSVSKASRTTLDDSNKIGNPSGLFDMREDFSSISQLPSHSLFPSTLFLEPLNVTTIMDPHSYVEKAFPRSSFSSLERSLPFVSSPPTDILEEIIRTFSILPSDP